MGKTSIEWCTDVWNPVTRCTKVSQGCKNCYVERVFPRAYSKTGRKFTDVKCHPERLDQPLRWKKPRRIFVNSMSDLFHGSVPEVFIIRVFVIMALAPKHTFQILTKRPERMRDFLANNRTRDYFVSLFTRAEIRDFSYKREDDGLPGVQFPNVQLGVSCEDQQTADERIPLLLQTPAAVRFISAEPLLGPIDLVGAKNLSPLHWVIVGGESGPNARPMHPDWVRSIRDQCQSAGVPFFFKQWGEWIPKRMFSEPGKGKNYDWGVLNLDGDWFSKTTPWNGHEGQDSSIGEYTMINVGKKAAGAVLDGREWREFPG